MSVLAEYVQAIVDDEPSVLETRLQFDKKWGAEKKLKTKLNLVLLDEYGDNRNEDVEFTVRLATVYKLHKSFRPGFEWHGGFGAVDQIGSFKDDQEHYFGPVVYGEFETFENGVELEYQLGYLPGVSNAASDHAFKFLLEFEYNF